VWERATGAPAYPAIGWQDGRTQARVREVLEAGLFTNSMASATKLEWILEHVPDGRARAAAGAFCFGTVDTWLAWQLSGGRAHVTDASNASCTGLYNPVTGVRDDAITEFLRLPPSLLPAVGRSSVHHGETDPAVLGARVPLGGIAGDQQAALFGELGLAPGSVKVTYGTGGMVDVNTGDAPVFSPHGAFPLILWWLEAARPFCLESTVVTAGAAVQWLRDGLGIVAAPEETAALAAAVPDSGGVWVVPAFQGLGTPHMNPAARAAIGGLSRGTTRAHIVRALLEGIAFRTREVLDTLLADAGCAWPAVLRVDGGAAANDVLLQILADTIGHLVERPATVQASALGAAYLAGLATGVWGSLDEVRDTWRSGGVFEPRGSAAERDERFHAWQQTAAAAQAGAVR
jgi:glycerol kinase